MPEHLPDEAQSSLLLDETAALFALHGRAVHEEVTRYLAPLLAGEQDFAGNRAMLLALLARAES